MQPLERTGVAGRLDRAGCRGFVVGPERDHEASTLIGAWLHPGIKSGHRAPGFHEPLSQLDFELRDLMRCRCYPSQDVTGQQSHGEPVRVLKDDRVVDGQAQ
jgi:hypothetical protein